MWRLMPFLFVCHVAAALDRKTVGFARLPRNSAIGLSEAADGPGAGPCFIACCLLEMPSTLALDHFAAPCALARGGAD
jgi:hypothetical protein